MNTKGLIGSLALAVGLLATQVSAGQAPAGAPAGTTAVCKDGTYYSGTSKKSACHGHKGLKEWYGAPEEKGGKSASKASKKGEQSASEKSASKGEKTASEKPASKKGEKSASEKSASKKGGEAASATGAAEPAATSESAATSKKKHGKAASETGAPESSAAASESAGAAGSAAASKTATRAQAAGGGAGKVWLNTDTNVYHCPGTRYYGTTKAGAYMTEEEAQAKGARPDRGKACK